MKTEMQAAVFQGVGSMSVQQRPVPVLQSGDILVRVSKAGICGTDIGAFRHGGYLPPGTVLGHEFCGEIIAVGDDIRGLSTGQRVTANPMKQLVGLLRDGAFAEYLTVPSAVLNDSVFVIPGNMSDIEAAMVEPLAVSLRGLNQCDLQEDGRVVVQGLGTIGACALLALIAKGVRNIVAIDRPGTRLDLARSLGIAVVELGNDNLVESVLAASAAQDSDNSARLGVDLVVDATGSPAAITSATEMLATNGQLLVLGTYKENEVPVNINAVVQKSLRILGSLAYDTEFLEAISLIASGDVKVDKLVTHQYGIDDIQLAFETAMDTEKSIKVMVDLAPGDAK